MKGIIRLFVVIPIFLIASESKSQDYIPMAVEGAHWIIAVDRIETPWLVDDLWEYYAEGDTSINDEIYKKIFYRPLVVTQDPPPFEPDGEYQLTGFIRDDTTD